MLKNKKIALVFICVGLAAVTAAIIISLAAPKQSYSTKIPPELDEAVARSIFSRVEVSLSDATIDGVEYKYASVDDKDRFLYSECMGEGHMILGYADKNGVTEVYALCSYIGYGFVNGVLVDNTGSFCIPTLVTFEKTKDGGYVFKSAEEAEDGGQFIPSIKKMFPADLAETAISAASDEAITTSMQEQCDAYAANYLKVIGRDAKISAYHEEDFKLLSDYGVSADVENILYGMYPEYGFYVGSFESIENGVRYVYAVQWEGNKKGTGTVTYTKTRYDSGKAVEKHVYSIKGDSIKEVKSKKK